MTDLLTPPVLLTPPPTKPVVVGLDTALGSASSSGTGIASSAGWCESVGYRNAKKPITGLPHRQRATELEQLAGRILLTIKSPTLVVMELPAPSRSGGGSHERAWLWWELYRRITRADIPVALMAPNQRALYATGKGNAGKTAVVDAVARRWPDWSTGGDDNLADAVALMAAGMDWLGSPLAKMPAVNRAAIDKAQWPTVVTS